jgi:hypothetical protein
MERPQYSVHFIQNAAAVGDENLGVNPNTRRYGSDHIVVVTCNKTPVRIVFLASLKSNSNNNVVTPVISVAGVSDCRHHSHTHRAGMS